MARRAEGLGSRLEVAMRKAGITQKRLADLVGTTQPAVSQWVIGAKVPADENLESIAKHLNVSLDWLKKGTGAMLQLPERDTELEKAEYEKKVGWRFRSAPKDGGRDYGNSNVWSFDPSLEVFVREVLQNAKDAAVGRDAVRVRFRFITLSGDDLDAYRSALKWGELKPHLDRSAQGKQKFNTLLCDGLSRVDKSIVLLLVEDEGTTGLTGPETGSGAFTALCRNNLDSNKGDAGAGGAFGLGKAVLWRASRLSTVLFNSHLATPEDNKQHDRVFGRCELAWHTVDDSEFAGPGWFGKADKDNSVSLWGNASLAKALYLTRSNPGTTACVLGFHDASDDGDRPPIELARDIVLHTATNFYPAIVAEKLEVTVQVYHSGQDFRNGKAALTQTVNPSEHLPAQVRMLTALVNGDTVESLGGEEQDEVAKLEVTLSVPKRTVDPTHPEQTHQAVLLVTHAHDEETEIQKRRQFRLAVFRGPGMVVFEESIQAACLGAQPFNALLICGRAASEFDADERLQSAIADSEAEQFLRVAEPPSHDRWTSTPDLTALYARGCVKKLNEFLKDAKRKVAELVKPKPKDTGDGPESMKELFRIGSEPSVRPEQPKITPLSSSIDEKGRWVVEAKIRIKSRKSVQRLAPAVYFLAETGGGTPVKWLTLTGVKDCVSEDQYLVIPANVREVRFRGVTDAADHPIPATDSCVTVDIRKSVVITPEATK